MFKRIRVAILLYIMAFIALVNFLAAARSTDWDETLQAYVDGLATADFEKIEACFSTEARRYGVRLDQPFRLELGPQVDNDIPQLASTPSMLDTLLWSLKMRWSASHIDSGSDRPDPDIKLFALYHEESAGAVLDRSTALERGLIAVTELFAGHSSTGANQIVMAHELLHTLGATDKYDLGTNLPIYPHGYANPEAHPLYPQRSAELMAGRVPLDERTAEIPSGLQLTVVGPETAAEIGWPTSSR